MNNTSELPDTLRAYLPLEYHDSAFRQTYHSSEVNELHRGTSCHPRVYAVVFPLDDKADMIRTFSKYGDSIRLNGGKHTLGDE
jgi:hypothetical protein